MQLLDRGHDPATLCPIFHEAYKVFIQRAFQHSIVQPLGDAHITELQMMNEFGGTPDFDSLIICYHGQQNLGNILSPRTKLHLGPAYYIDATIAKLQDNG